MTTYTVTVDDVGTKHWYHNGKLHRADGPAIEYANGTKEWCNTGMRHRADGPAIEYDGPSGAKVWYLNDEVHRTDGPAIEYTDGLKEWYLNGKQLSEAHWNEAIMTDAIDQKKTCTETEETLSDWEKALSENDYKKLLNSKLSFIQCFSIDQVQREEGLPEQAWDKETYDELFDARG